MTQEKLMENCSYLSSHYCICKQEYILYNIELKNRRRRNEKKLPEKSRQLFKINEFDVHLQNIFSRNMYLNLKIFRCEFTP